MGPVEAADPGEPQWGLVTSEGSAGDGVFPGIAETLLGCRAVLLHTLGPCKVWLRGCSRKFCGSCMWLGVSRCAGHRRLALRQWEASTGRKLVTARSPGPDLHLGHHNPFVPPGCCPECARTVPTVSKRRWAGALRTPRGCGWPARVTPPCGLFQQGGWQMRRVHSVPLAAWAFSPRTHPACGCGACAGPGCRGEPTAGTRPP